MTSQVKRDRNFPWWIVGVWTGILATLFYWLWKQRGKDPLIQPIQVDLSFFRHPSAPLPQANSPTELLVASPTTMEIPVAQVTASKPAETAQPDDLTLIHGIGPKIARVLEEAGIHSFKHLAQTAPETLREILQAAHINIRLADPESWPTQAQLAAQGNWDESKGAVIRRQMGRDS